MSLQSAPADKSMRLLAALAYPIWVIALIMLWTAFIVLSLYYAIQAYNAREVSIPVVSDLARKYQK